MKNIKKIQEIILVSSCLLGECCKYNGGNNKNSKVVEYLKNNHILPVCPEVLGGLPIPRPPAEIIGGDGFSVLEGKARVVNSEGIDVTTEFLIGANKTLMQCIENKCKMAILKANSPSCSSKKIYDGSFTSKKICGVGVTSALLLNNNIEIYSEEDMDGLFKGNRKQS